jgi:hypothetical protein
MEWCFMADEEMMDLDEVIEEEGTSEDTLATSLIIVTTVFLLVAIIITLAKLKGDYDAGIFS